MLPIMEKDPPHETMHVKTFFFAGYACENYYTTYVPSYIYTIIKYSRSICINIYIYIYQKIHTTTCGVRNHRVKFSHEVPSKSPTELQKLTLQQLKMVEEK